jgi:fructokinase
MLAGVEGGGTTFVVGVGPDPSNVTDRHVVPTTTPAATLGAVRAWLTGHEDVTGLGIATFGALDLDPRSRSFGRVTVTGKPGWSGADVLGTLSEGLGVPVAIDTDVNAAALAEQRQGDVPGADPLVYLTVGTGVGGGVVVGGRPVHGLVHPELGHLPVQRHPDDDFGGTCVFHGDCLEGMACGPAVAARFGRAGEELTPTHGAAELLGWYLAQAVAAATFLLSPRRFVLGGGVLAMPGLLDAVRLASADRLAGALPHRLLTGGLEDYVVRSSLWPDAGLRGALELAADAVVDADA